MLLYTPEKGKKYSPIRGITRLDKLMFLLSRLKQFENLFEGDYEFVPYNFGPFATELLDDLEALKSENLVVVVESRNPKSATETRDAELIDEETGEVSDESVSWDQYQFEVYSLSTTGIEVAERLFNAATKEQQEKIIEIKESFNSKSLTGLLRYVYHTYPKFAAQSTIKSEVMGRL